MNGMVDARCTHRMCNDRNIYRMVGACSNCGLADVLILYTSTHEADTVDCPTCGTRNLRPIRLASPDEIPAAVGPSGE